MGVTVPGCKLLCREVNMAISRAVKGSKLVYLTDELQRDLECWRFINSWTVVVGVEVSAIVRLYCPPKHLWPYLGRTRGVKIVL